jgi:hypothetical protein
VFAVMMRGRPPIGDKFFIFYYTGIIPYHLCVCSYGKNPYIANGLAALFSAVLPKLLPNPLSWQLLGRF